MNNQDTGTGIKIIVASAVALLLMVISSITFAQTMERPEKPTPEPSVYQQMDFDGQHVQGLQPVQSTANNSTQMGYWSHLTTNNTGELPFGESLFYAGPRYWNYVFVDSRNRLFVDSGGLFVWNGFWQEVTLPWGGQITNVREMIEDDSGNLWVGTNNGLFELSNTLDFITEHHIGNSLMKKNDVNTLLQADDGSIWVGHRWHEETGGGVTILNHQVIDSLDGYTNDIIQRNNGDIWVAQAPDDQGNGGFIYVYRPSNDSSWTYTESDGLPHSEVDNFSKDSQGNIWMGHYATQHHPMGGVTRFDGASWTHFDQSDGLPQAGAWYTYAASDDKVYYTTGDSMMVYDSGSWSHFDNGNDRFPIRGATIVTEDRENNLVIGADPGADGTGGGVHIYDGTSWDFISNHTDNGLFSNVIFGADVDTEGNLWFSGFFGATMYDGENWTYFSENDGMSDTYPWKLLGASDGSMWFATGGEVTQYKDGQFTVHSQYSDFAETVFEDSQGNIWFGAWNWINAGNEGGILRYDGSTFTVFDDTDGVIGNNVTAFGEGPSGNIYASTDAGAIEFDGTSWSEFPVDGQTGTYVGELASDSQNNLWFDIDGAIKKWDGSAWTTYDGSDGYMGWTTHIEPATDGTIWLAGDDIQVIHDGNLLDMTPPGFSATAYVITHDQEGATWVGTYAGGIYKYDMSQGLTIESVEDYPDDEGFLVTVKAGGFLMDPYRISDSGFDGTSWGVERKNGSTWESVGFDPDLDTINQLTVNTPTTMPTGEDLEAHKYDFRVVIYNSSRDALAYSDPVTAYALDNLAPEVNSVSAQRGNESVTVSWSSANASDFKQYEVVSADDPNGTPLATTTQNNVLLSDTQYSGVQEFLVRARDRHENVGVSSEAAVAAFPMDFNYHVEERWNLIGLPLDVDPADIDNLQSKIKEGTLYEFSGSYEQAQELEPGKGYWAKFDANATYEVPGLPLVEQQINLEKGWNLISGVGASLNADQIQDPNNIVIEGTLSGFDGAYTQSATLDPGAGYWLRASEAGTVTLSLAGNTSTTVQKKSASPLAKVKEGLNEVTVGSSNGYQKTLYFGKELPKDVNPLSFSLPPKAPGNSFDVRFAHDDMSYTESNSFSIAMQKESTADITIDLNLVSTNEHQKYLVQELKGNKVLTEYEVSGGKSITLKNSQVTSLKMMAAGAQQASQDLPDKFDLSPSYPNPFNPSTTIQYQLPEQVAVRLEVFDMVGRKVQTLMAGEQQEAGTHTIRFNASKLSSGMYFVRLRAGTFQEIQKITLIK